jgi:nicotinate-nucleotide adenylyltransferase
LTRVGVLGGSFDPVHRGHVALGLQALWSLGLDRVLLLPCSDPPHKPDRSLAARYHRLEMLYLAVQDRAGLEVSTLEIAQGGVRYTIDTLRALRDGSAPVAPVFLCGSDALLDLPSWRDHEALLREFDFAAVVRTRDDVAPIDPVWPPVIANRVESLPAAGSVGCGEGGHVYFLPMPEVPISSSAVRARCAAGMRVDDLVPAGVARYIQRHRLYSEEVGS